MIKKQNIVLITFIILIINVIISICIIYYFNNNKKIGGVDLYKLTDNFQMKKEMEATMNKSLINKKNTVDSLDKFIKASLNSGRKLEDLKSTIDLYKSRSLEFEKEFQELNGKISSSIWNRLNPLIKEYGEKKGYSMIVGGNGTGSLLYLNNSVDITDDLIKFINESYSK